MPSEKDKQSDRDRERKGRDRQRERGTHGSKGLVLVDWMTGRLASWLVGRSAVRERQRDGQTKHRLHAG